MRAFSITLPCTCRQPLSCLRWKNGDENEMLLLLNNVCCGLQVFHGEEGEQENSWLHDGPAWVSVCLLSGIAPPRWPCG